MFFNVAIIGCGNIGYRHLQGLSKSINRLNIYIVENNRKTIDSISKSEFVKINFSKNQINFLKNISELPNKIDIAIIATTSNIRYKLTREILRTKEIKHLILEKIVFQSAQEFLKIEKILKSIKTMVWINFVRRKYDFYQKIKNQIKGRELSIYFNSSDCGMGCNAIHFIDLLSFITNESDLNIDLSKLDKRIYNSKRDGYVEFKGKMVVNTKKGDSLTLIDKKNNFNDQPLVISFSEVKYEIYEDLNRVSFFNGENKKELKINFPYLSQLSAEIVDEIIKKNSSELTSYSEMMKFHIPLIKKLNDHIFRTTGEKVSRCPIT